MTNVIKSDNALVDFTQWAQSVVDEGSDKSDLLSKLMGNDGTFVTSVKMSTGEANLQAMDVEYVDGVDGATRRDSIVITPEDSELCEGTYEDFCKAIYVGMCSSCLSTEQLAKTL